MILLNTSPNSINADFHFVPTVHLADTDSRRRQGVRGDAGRDGHDQQGHDRLQRTGSVHARRSPRAARSGRRRRPVEAGRDRPGSGHPRRGRASRQHWSRLRPLQRHLDVRPARRRPRRAPEAEASRLVADGDQVGAHDDGVRRARRRRAAGRREQPGADLPPGRRSRPAERRCGSGPRLRQRAVNDWLAFLCGTTTAVGASTCTALKNAGYSIDASDMNVASIAIGDLAGVQTVKRRVTERRQHGATYTASVTGMTGIATTVTPSSLTLARGETSSFTVTFTRTTAALNAYVGGRCAGRTGHTSCAARSSSNRSPSLRRPRCRRRERPARHVQPPGTTGTLLPSIRASRAATPFGDHGAIR